MRINRTITAKNRAELVVAVAQAPVGATFDLVDDPRTLAQNRLLWLLLSQLAEELPHCGELRDPESWKAAFLKAMGKELTFMPALDGEGVVAVGYRSSRLSKQEMSEMIERIYEYGTRHGVEFHGTNEEEANGQKKAIDDRRTSERKHHQFEGAA